MFMLITNLTCWEPDITFCWIRLTVLKFWMFHPPPLPPPSSSPFQPHPLTQTPKAEAQRLTQKSWRQRHSLYPSQFIYQMLLYSVLFKFLFHFNFNGRIQTVLHKLCLQSLRLCPELKSYVITTFPGSIRKWIKQVIHSEKSWYMTTIKIILTANCHPRHTCPSSWQSLARSMSMVPRLLAATCIKQG